jgi:hypothetical protein
LVLFLILLVEKEIDNNALTFDGINIKVTTLPTVAGIPGPGGFLPLGRKAEDFSNLGTGSKAALLEEIKRSIRAGLRSEDGGSENPLRLFLSSDFFFSLPSQLLFCRRCLCSVI